MNLRIPTSVVKRMKQDGCTNTLILDAVQEGSSWEREHTIASKFLSPTELALLKKIVKLDEFYKNNVECRRLYSQLLALEKIAEEGEDAPIRNLEFMCESIVAVMTPLPHHWVFSQDEETGTLVPYIMESCTFHPKRGRDETPAHIQIKTRAMRRGSHADDSAHIEREDLGVGGMTVQALLEKKGMVLETPELVAAYEKDMEAYRKFHTQTGEQFNARGTGLARRKTDDSSSRWWDSFKLVLEREGQPSKVVMDDGEDWGKDSAVVATSFWDAERRADDEAAPAVTAPVHPIVRAFDLRTHLFFTTHITNLTPYVYTPSMADKLVLPVRRKELINILISSASTEGQDIVKGKGGGVIVLCSGEPGTGKTLTAEVYSESAKRPLYIVQCSQLGTDPDDLEKKLADVLTRAVRWKAILLIDEADVYIHSRGSNIKQNAIVGVFLRLLEYYTGVLFMTTNRGTEVDDAILSRVMAHVRYTIPDADDQAKIWAILAKQYMVDLSSSLVKALVEAFPGISGRSIKQLIRLSKVLAEKRKEPITVKLVQWVSQFQDLESKVPNGNGQPVAASEPEA